jgi:hypothetical protein
MAASGFAANVPPDINILNALAEINTALAAIRVGQVAADLRLGTIQQQNVGSMATAI